MPAPRVRTGTADDHETIRRIVNEAYLVERWFIDGERLSEADVIVFALKGTWLVGEDAGAIAAAVYVELRGERAYFGPLAVDPARQGHGWGRRMVAAAEAFARAHGCRVMDLSVLSLRAELPPFYEKLGYRVTGRAPFEDPGKLQDCERVLMEKML